MSGNLLAVEVARVATFINPTSPTVLAYDGRAFVALKSGVNVSGQMNADEAADFISTQVRSAVMTAETSGVWEGAL